MKAIGLLLSLVCLNVYAGTASNGTSELTLHADCGNKYYSEFPNSGDCVTGTSGTVTVGYLNLAEGSNIWANDSASGFGTGPTVEMFEDFEQGSSGTAISTSNTNYDSADTAEFTNLAARSGSLSLDPYGDFNSDGNYSMADPEVNCTDPTDLEMFGSFSVIIPDGKRAPGTDAGDEDWPSTSSWKLNWIIDEATNDDDFNIPSQNAAEAFAIGGNDIGVVVNLGTNPTWWAWDVWNRFTFWIKAGSPDPESDAGNLYTQVINTTDGFTEPANDNSKVLFDVDNPPHEWELIRVPGWARTRTSSDMEPTDPDLIKTYYDDIYVACGANAFARVELGNNATYSSITKGAILVPSSWTSSDIVATIKSGDLALASDSIWLYLFDATDAATDKAPDFTVSLQ